MTKFFLPALFAGLAFAQTVPAPAYAVGSKLPATCNVGDLYFLTGTTVGHNLYGCAQTNGWALEGIGTGIITQPPPTPPAGTTASVAWATPPVGLSVPAKQSLAITFDRAATWTLQSGSRGSISVKGNTVTYSAPSIKATSSVAGCQPLPSDSIFTTPIAALPVHASSAAWIAQSTSIGSVAISFGQSWGHNIVDNTLAPTPMTFFYTTGLNGAQYQLLSGNNRNREEGSLTTDGGNDHHMVTINHQTCHTYETYHDYLTGNTPNPQYTANSGYDYSSSTYTQPKFGTTDAAGLPLLPLIAHLSEWEAGAIKHALRFTSCVGCVGKTYLWPATGTTGAVPTAAPMGTRWRLKASFDISRFSPKAQVMLTALQQYGMILADLGGIDQIQVDDDINEDPALNAALGEIQAANINQSAFDIVDESSLMIDASLNRANPANGKVTPQNFAQLNGVDANGNKLSLPIAIQPVLIGTQYETLQIQAGMPYQMHAWVNNASTQSLTWAVTSGPGTISSTGVYLPPASVTTPTAFVITATAVADTSATLQIRGNVIPSGAIRIDVGNPSPYTDAKNNVWMADNLGVLSGSYNNDNETYPSAHWGTLADWFLYGWDKTTWGDDIVYGPFVVPNGTYNVTFLMADTCTGTLTPTATFDNGLTTGGLYALDVNGSITQVNFATLANGTCRTPGNSTVPVTVTNNLLTVALRATGTDGTHTAPFLSALQIAPVGN